MATQQLTAHTNGSRDEAILSVVYDDTTLAVQGFKVEKNTRTRGAFHVTADGRRLDINMESQRVTDVTGTLAGERDREDYVNFPFSVAYET